MRRYLLIIAIAMTAVAATATVAGTAAAGQTSSEPDAPFQGAGLEDVLRSLVQGDNPLITEVPSAQPFSPLAGDVVDETGESTIVDAFELVIKAEPSGIPTDRDADLVPGFEPGIGGLPPGPGGLIRISGTGDGEFRIEPNPLTEGFPGSSEIPVFGGVSAHGVDDLLGQLGVDPSREGPQDALGTQVTVARPLNPGSFPPGAALTVWGAHTRGDYGSGAPCSGSPYIYEAGRAFQRMGSPSWVPADFAPNDLFTGTSDAIVVRCRGGGWHVDALTNAGSSFQQITTNTTALVFSNGFIAFTPSREFVDATGHRAFAFRTPAQGGYQPGNTFATTYPEFPMLMEPHAPVVVGDPYPTATHGPFPLALDLTASTYEAGSEESTICGTDWSAAFEVYVFETPTPGTMDVGLYQFSSGQHTMGTLIYTGSEFSLTTAGGGEGYTEGFSFGASGGEYTFQPQGLECAYTVSVSAGMAEFMAALDGFAVTEPTAAPSSTSGVPTSSTSKPDATGATDAPASSPTSSIVEESASTDDDTQASAIVDAGGDGFPWSIAAVISGLILILGGYLITRTRNGDRAVEKRPTESTLPLSGPSIATTTAAVDPCDRLRRLYVAAKAEAETKRKAADDADSAADDAEVKAGQTESDAAEAGDAADDAARDRKRAERNRNAPEPGDKETYIEDSATGERITLTDLRNRRAAAREAWDGYSSDPSPESAAQTESDWEDLDAEGARAQRRADWEADQAARAKDLAEAEAAENEANTARDEAKEAADAADQAAKDARAEADRLETDAAAAESSAAELKRLLDECLGLMSGESTRWGGPMGLSEDPGGGCFPEGNVERRVLATFDQNVKINWWVTVRPSSSAREDARRIAGELRWWRDVFGTGSAAINVVGAVQGLTTRALGDAAETALSGASVAAGEELGIDIPTVLPQVPLVVLEGLAATSAAIVDKWGEWIENNHVEWIAEFGFQVKDVKMTWVEIWKCENGVKKCVERVLEIDMGDVRNTGAVHTETYQPRENWQRRVDGLGRTMARQAQASSQAMVTFMGQYKAGDC